MNEALTILGAACIIFLVLRGLYNRRYDTPKKLRGNLPTLKDGTIEYPGHMAFANKGGEYFHGCRVAHFKDIADLNAFFCPGNAGHLKLVAEIIPQNDGSVLCVYNNKLSAEDMEEVEEFNREMHAHFSKRKEEREAQKQEEREAKYREEQETKRLAEVGRRYESRVKSIRLLPPGTERKEAEKRLNGGELDE